MVAAEPANESSCLTLKFPAESVNSILSCVTNSRHRRAQTCCVTCFRKVDLLALLVNIRQLGCIHRLSRHQVRNADSFYGPCSSSCIMVCYSRCFCSSTFFTTARRLNVKLESLISRHFSSSTPFSTMLDCGPQSSRTAHMKPDIQSSCHHQNEQLTLREI